MNNALFRRLLGQGEGSKLDSKRDGYAFEGASIGEKAELLKDILARANAWGAEDAYIVSKVRGRPAAVVGLTRHLEDAELQQFVNERVNRRILFDHREWQQDGAPLAAIHVPTQKRPFYLSKQFGNIKAAQIFVREGSSTRIADRDEVFHMGEAWAAPKVPDLAVRFWDPISRRSLGGEAVVASLLMEPLSDEALPAPPRWSSGALNLTPERPNSRFYVELREYPERGTTAAHLV